MITFLDAKRIIGKEERIIGIAKRIIGRFFGNKK